MSPLNSQFRNGRLPAGNPLANVLVIVVGILVIGLSLLLGVVAFIALAGLFLVAGAVIGIRSWWHRRRFGRRPTHRRDDAIEGEFRVVTRDRGDERD